MKYTQDPRRRAQDAARRSQDAPRRPQDAPKSPPGRPQDAEDAPQGAGTVAGTRLCRAKDIPVVRSTSFKRFDISAAVDEHFYCGALCLNFNRNRSAASSRKAFSIKTCQILCPWLIAFYLRPYTFYLIKLSEPA